MPTSTTCCQEFWRSCLLESPFSRIIITDWYDGLVNGLLECRSCRRGMSCSLAAWSISTDMSIWACGTLPARSFSQAWEAALKVRQPNTANVWVHIGCATDESRRLSRQFSSLLNAAAMPGWLIAGKAIPGECFAVGELWPQDASLLRPADVETVAARPEEWFRTLAGKMDWQNGTIDAHLGDSDV